MLRILISALLSYLLGSISPSYILGRILKGIDIREHGDGNAGTVNTYHILGLFPAIITAIFDLSKGLISFYISSRFLNLEGFLLSIPIVFSVLGHIFPFYLNFRGGQGAGTSTGFLLYFLAIQISRGFFPIESLIVLSLLVLISAYVARKGEFVGIFILPVFLFLNIYFGRGSINSFYISLVTIYLIGLQLRNIIRYKFYELKEKKDVRWWRVALRPLAMLFVIIDFYYGNKNSLILIGIVAMFFLFTDISRLAHRKVEKFMFSDLKYIFKKSEEGKFSSMTLFLLASFAIFLIFPRDISYLAFTFLVFGDLLSKIYGMRFGRIKLVGERTLEGTLSYFMGSLSSGYILSLLIGIDIKILIIGSILASLTELVSIGIDDNFGVGIISGIGMSAFRYFKII